MVNFENKVCINTYHQIFIPDFMKTVIFKDIKKKFLKENNSIKKIEIKKEEGKFCFYFIPKVENKDFTKDEIRNILNFVIEIKEKIEKYFINEEVYDNDLNIRGYIYNLFYYNSRDNDFSILIDTRIIKELDNQLPDDINILGKIILVDNNDYNIKIETNLYLIEFPIYVVLSFECEYYEDKSFVVTEDELKRIINHFDNKKDD